MFCLNMQKSDRRYGDWKCKYKMDTRVNGVLFEQTDMWMNNLDIDDNIRQSQKVDIKFKKRWSAFCKNTGRIGKI